MNTKLHNPTETNSSTNNSTENKPGVVQLIVSIICYLSFPRGSSEVQGLIATTKGQNHLPA